MNYTAEEYKGTKTGQTGFNYKLGVQIVATDENDTRRKVFTVNGDRPYKTACFKLWEGVAHYKSGLNTADNQEFMAAMKDAKRLAKEWTAAGTHE